MKKFKLLIAFIAICIAAFAQVPSITSISPDSGAVGTLVTIRGTNLDSPSAFIIGGVSAILVSRSADSLVGMALPGAAGGMVSVTTVGGTATSVDSFYITATGYPKSQPGLKLIGTGAVGSAGEGYSVAISADGNTAIVGAPTDSNYTGAAWIFTRMDSLWVQTGNKLVGTGAAGAATQGSSVAISADGSTAIVGGPNDSSGVGAAWIFTRIGGVWLQQGSKIVGTGAIDTPYVAYQGSSVAISADGNTAMVGGYQDANLVGAVWMYIRSGTTWSQQGNKLVGTGSVGLSEQGFSVALSADGNTAVEGGYQDNSKGAVWVFARSGGVWSQQGSKLVGSHTVGIDAF